MIDVTCKSEAMYQYHGWMSSNEKAIPEEIARRLRELNHHYPVSASFVNGQLHISFSGHPNRDCGELKRIVNYLTDLKLGFFGCIYVNDANSQQPYNLDCIKIVKDVATRIRDQNFTSEETKSVFE